MSAKVHIVDSAEPLSNRFWDVTRCGLTIEKPKFVFMWDMQEMGAEMSLVGCCRKCLKVDDPKLRYTYGVKV